MSNLSSFLIKRLIHSIIVFWVAVTAIFSLRLFIPGDIATIILPEDASPALRDEVRSDLGLDRPMYEQYIEYVLGLLQGDLGYSYLSRAPVTELMLPRLVPTIELAVAAMIVAIVFAIPFGIISAQKRNSPTDFTVTMGSLAGVSTPNFWLGLMLVLVLGVWFGLFPTSRQPLTFVSAVSILIFDQQVYGLIDWLRHITLPAITLGTYYMALLTRLTRGGMLDELGQLYITAARAKGLPNPIVNYKHALTNTLIPLITIVALNIGGLIAGSIVVEEVFAWPGVGNLFIDSINRQDWPVVQSLLIFVTLGYVGMNTLADILYTFVNPEVSYND